MKEYFRLLRFVKPYKLVLGLVVVLMGLTTLVSTVANVGLIIPFITRIIADKTIDLPGNAGPFITKIIDYLNSLYVKPFIYPTNSAKISI